MTLSFGAQLRKAYVTPAELIAGYVPYDGAHKDVNLGTQKITFGANGSSDSYIYYSPGPSDYLVAYGDEGIRLRTGTAKSVTLFDFCGRVVMQNHVHTCQAACGPIFFLTV
jgi:hypothetical protein